jgi:hypothetical protein
MGIGEKFFTEADLKAEFQKYRTILVVACESGGAKILASLIRRMEGNFRFLLDGPPVSIFQNRFDNFKNESSGVIASLKSDNDLMLTGTSWMPVFERQAIASAKKQGTPVWSFLDHWTNYRERFLPTELWDNLPAEWTGYLPDKVVVSDVYANDLAVELGFPEEKLLLIPNFSLQDFKDEYEYKSSDIKRENKAGLHILLVTEPIADDVEKTFGQPDYWGYTEYDVVADLTAGCMKHGSDLRIRLHPNEAKGKYDWIAGQEKSFEISDHKDIIDDFIWADIVVGIHSMALVLALTAGKKTVSYLPPKAKHSCFLPHNEINKLHNTEEIFN